MMERKRDLALAEVLRQANETHQRLVEYIQSVADEQFTGDTRWRRRLRLDTYHHYPIHIKAIAAWRERKT